MEEKQPLDDLLSTWNPEVANDPAFQEKVWRRIAVDGNREFKTGQGRVSRWPILTTCAAAIVAGFFLGTASFSTDKNATATCHEDAGESVHARYFARINPLSELR